MVLNLIKDQLKGWVILVVDDEPDCLEIAARWLKLAGATVLSASNGGEGLESASVHAPNLILADLSMPVMDGWEMQRRLIENPETARIPVIAVTAHAMQGVKEQVMTTGFVAHISKPLDPRKLIALVIQVLKDTDEPRHCPDG